MSELIQEASQTIEKIADMLDESKENTIALIAIRYAKDYLYELEASVQENSTNNQGANIYEY